MTKEEKIAELTAQIDVRMQMRNEIKEAFENDIVSLKKRKKETLSVVNKEIVRLQTRLRYWKDPERYIEYRKAYYEKNRKQILKQAQKKRMKDQAFRERQKEYRHAYYLKRKAAGFYERGEA